MTGCIEIGYNKTFSTRYFVNRYLHTVKKSNFCEEHRPYGEKYFKTREAAELWLIKESL